MKRKQKKTVKEAFLFSIFLTAVGWDVEECERILNIPSLTETSFLPAVLCLHPLLLGEMGKINGWDSSPSDAPTDEGSLNRFYSKGPFLQNILCDASNKSDRCLSKLEYAWLNSCCHPPLTFIYSRGYFFYYYYYFNTFISLLMIHSPGAARILKGLLSFF